MKLQEMYAKLNGGYEIERERLGRGKFTYAVHRIVRIEGKDLEVDGEVREGKERRAEPRTQGRLKSSPITNPLPLLRSSPRSRRMNLS